LDSFPTDHPECNIIEGNVRITGSDITNLNGLSGLSSIEGDLIIENNELLVSLSGFNNLSYIGGDLKIYDNDLLPNLNGLDDLVYVGGSLHIGTYVEIGAGVNFYGNPFLESLYGLNMLGSVGMDLIITANVILPDLSGLDNISSIGGKLHIWWNQAITSLDGLNNISAFTIKDLLIRDNTSLSNCVAKSICDYLSAPNGMVDIFGNDLGCYTIDEALEACESFGIDENDILNFKIFPNPAGSQILISTSVGTNVCDISIFNLVGQELLNQRYSESPIDIDFLKQGIYIIKLTTDKGIGIGRLLKR
jgi:hypothetical protein